MNDLIFGGLRESVSGRDGGDLKYLTAEDILSQFPGENVGG